VNNRNTDGGTKMHIENEEVVINGVSYVKADSFKKNMPMAENYCIVRTRSAGVFAGNLANRNGTEGTVLNARRLWYWSGAASLSQLSVDGTVNPDKCKFPCEVESVFLTEIIEVLPCTAKAMKSISEVDVWQM